MAKKLTGNGIFESSRMILPEHKARIFEHSELSRRGGPRQRPNLTDTELEEIGQKLEESRKTSGVVNIYTWNRDDRINGIVSKIDGYQRKVKVDMLFGETELIKFEDIIKVERE